MSLEQEVKQEKARLTNQFKAMATHLRKLANEEIKPRDPSCGICSELYEEFNYHIDMNIFANWPKFSGSVRFPIKATSLQKRKYEATIKEEYSKIIFFELEIALAEVAFQQEKNLWIDDQGVERRELCLWLAEYFERIKL